jgi:signal transduction histidine kinase
VRQIQTRNETIRNNFLARNKALDQIRSDLYLSGTYVRDYLLEPDPAMADRHRASLEQTKLRMTEAIAAYQHLLPAPEAPAFSSLRHELDLYWTALDPILRWNQQQRAQFGYPFLRDDLFPRRTNMLRVAGQIAAMNEQQLTAGNLQVGELFTQFRRRMGITLGITLGLGLLLAAFSMTRILRLERESSARYQEIAKARTELKDLSARLLEAQENERRAISRELHDEVGQALSALLVELGNLSAARPENWRGHLDTIKKLAENSVNVVRNMALLLRPSMLDDFGLLPALQWQAREVSKRTGMRVNIAAENVSDDLPEEHKTCVYRVVQEALHNCSRHAAASMVRVTVRQEPHRIHLAVQDDGKGFEPKQRGLGLLGMEERVTHLGGDFQVESTPGHGTILNVVLPLAS